MSSLILLVITCGFVALAIAYMAYANYRVKKLFAKSQVMSAMEAATHQGFSEAILILFDAGIKYQDNLRLETDSRSFKLPYGFWSQSSTVIATTLLTLWTKNRDLANLFVSSLANLLHEQCRLNPRLILAIACEMAYRDRDLFKKVINELN